MLIKYFILGFNDNPDRKFHLCPDMESAIQHELNRENDRHQKNISFRSENKETRIPQALEGLSLYLLTCLGFDMVA